MLTDAWTGSAVVRAPDVRSDPTAEAALEVRVLGPLELLIDGTLRSPGGSNLV